MASSWLNAYRPPLETATAAELAVELCDAALVRLQPNASQDRLFQAQQAIYALATMVNPAAEDTATNLLRLYEYCLFRLNDPSLDALYSVRATLSTLRRAFAQLDQMPAEIGPKNNSAGSSP